MYFTEEIMHEGHRTRLINKIKNPEGLYEHEMMEILLFNACPRKDLNDIAHRLVDRFGGIAGVLHADIEQLLQVEGIGKSMAEYIFCLGACLKRVGGSEMFATATNTYELGKFLTLRAGEENRDKVELYLLDADSRIRRVFSFDFALYREKELLSDAVLSALSFCKSGSVYAAHFISGGAALPERGDDVWTFAIANAGELGGIKLNDYCIFGGEDKLFSYFVEDRLPANAR